MALTVGSLFAGIGGFDLAAERAGLEVKWQVEIDDYCTKVLERHWPEVKRYRDVRQLRAPEPAWVDVICGGFPCQDISVAGNRAGINGHRSGLWREFSRLVRELRPAYVIVENSSALATRGLDRVLGDLAAIGYDAEWESLPASAFGAPHVRDRMWVVAYPGEPQRRRSTWTGRRERCESEITIIGRRRNWTSDGIWETEPAMGRVVHGLPRRVDELAALGNAIVPQVAEWIFRQIVNAEGAHVNP
jgi:DNA (cytosine-5)-methyltransferase 1